MKPEICPGIASRTFWAGEPFLEASKQLKKRMPLEDTEMIRPARNWMKPGQMKPSEMHGSESLTPKLDGL